MYEPVIKPEKSELLCDWNANETPESPGTSLKPLETEMNSVEESTDNSKTLSPKRKVDTTRVGKEKIPRRTKVCWTVPVNHFGPIPGIPVGTCWERRIQVSEVGIHRPPVAGIHGRENEGAYSIVFSGTYDEDKDEGEEFYYSGCGGGVTDPSKLISDGQVCNQTLTCHNKALAVSCNVPLNDEVGAEATDWKAGKPIRVVRTHKLKKHSIYAPAEGNRYDGIYKVVKYFPVIGKSGLLVWRFLLRRDDPEPAPWTDEGKQAIAEKNLQMIRPEKTDYSQTSSKSAKKKSVKRLSGKSPTKKYVYPFPDEETFEKIIRDALNATSNGQETISAMSPKKSKSKKSTSPQSPKKRTRTKSKKSRNRNAIANKTAGKRMMSLGMGLAPTDAGGAHVSPDSDPLTTNGLLESPRKRNRKQNLNEVVNIDPREYTFYPLFDVENGSAQMNYFTFPSEVVKIDENDCEAVEIVPDISFWQENISPGPLREDNCNSQTNRSRVASRQLTEADSKMGIQVSSVKSLNHKKVAANKTSRNKARNGGKNRIADVTEPLKPQNQIDLTIEDEPYVLPIQVEKFIDSDTLNETIWEYCKKNFLKNETDFLDAVKLMFTCRYCKTLAANPVTTPCDHNVCLECISNHFLKQMYECPDCRNTLGPSFKIKENRNLANALENLFPGYNLRY